MTGIRPPPLLLGATLLFWGWQTGFIGAGAIMALVIELPRWSKTRWELSEEEFSRVWVFCTMLLLAGVVYAFTLNEGPSRFSELFDDPDLRNQTMASASSARTAASLIRWLPMIFFLFMAAQQYSSRGGVPLETISVILRRRWKKAKKLGLPMPPSRSIDISYVYFILCLFAASIHTDESRRFFWGTALLIAWALWPFRSPRFRFATWAICLGMVVTTAWFGQQGVGHLQQYIENLNPQWLSSMARNRFDATQAKTSLGQIGRLKSSPRIVIRVQGKVGPVPQLLREASYTTYRGRTWHSTGRTRDFERVDEDPIAIGTFMLVPGKTNLASVGISSFLPGRNGLLPLPSSTGLLTNLPAFGLEKNAYGAVHAQGPGLVVFEAQFGPGPMMDSPPEESEYLNVPSREEAALDKVIEELDLSGRSREEIMDRLQDYFGGFEYSTWQDNPYTYRRSPMPPGGNWSGSERRYGGDYSVLNRFLHETKRGHCEFFATATVLLLQRLEIPARYAVGYAVHEAGAGERQYVVRQRDAHAWCLVWDESRSIWRDFDTTPASWTEAESQHGWSQTLSDSWSRFVFEFLKIQWGQTQLRQYILWIVIPILFILLGQIIFSRRKRLNTKTATSAGAVPWPGLDSEFYELEKRLAKRGFFRLPGEPVSIWLQRGIRDHEALSAANETLREVLSLHYRYRFDPIGIDGEDRELLRRHARTLSARLDHA